MKKNGCNSDKRGRQVKNGCNGDKRVGNDEERGATGTRGLGMTKNGCNGHKRVGNDEERVLRERDGWE